MRVSNYVLCVRIHSPQHRVGVRIFEAQRTGSIIVGAAETDGHLLIELQIALNKLSDDSEFCGGPAISNGQLFIRSDAFLYCVAAQ